MTMATLSSASRAQNEEPNGQAWRRSFANLGDIVTLVFLEVKRRQSVLASHAMALIWPVLPTWALRPCFQAWEALAPGSDTSNGRRQYLKGSISSSNSDRAGFTACTWRREVERCRIDWCNAIQPLSTCGELHIHEPDGPIAPIA